MVPRNSHKPEHPLRRYVGKAIPASLHFVLLLAGCMVYRNVEPRGETRPELRRYAASLPPAREAELAETPPHAPGQMRPRLTWNPILAKVARERAWDVAVRGYFAHVT